MDQTLMLSTFVPVELFNTLKNPSLAVTPNAGNFSEFLFLWRIITNIYSQTLFPGKRHSWF